MERDDRTQLWRVDVTDDGGRLVATGRVRLMTLRHGAIAEVGSRYASQPPAADPPVG